MLYKLILDENYYLKGFVHTGTNEDTIELSLIEMDLENLDCYHIVEDKILFDVDKKSRKDNKKLLIEEKENIETWLKDHDYIGTKIATGRATIEEYATEIEEMTAKANRINEIDIELEKL